MLKKNICKVLALGHQSLSNPFEIEVDSRGYVMGVVLMQEGRSITYHSKTFSVSYLQQRDFDFTSSNEALESIHLREGDNNLHLP